MFEVPNHTLASRGYPFEVVLPEGLPTRGAILSDQVKSLDWRSRKARAESAYDAAPSGR